MQTGTPPTIMVINDDALQLRLAAAGLQKDGLGVLTCESAEEALELLHNGTTVDAIVTDLHMPGIDGWRLCRLLRSAEYAACNHVPILVLSATFSGVDAEQMTRDLGANAFLPIPYEPMALRTCVRALLAGCTPQAPRRVLIAAANPGLTALLSRTLESHGYTVEVACTGDEARRLLQEQSPDLVILDEQLPDMPGDQLLAACTGSEQSTVAIMLLAHATPALALQCMRLGAYGYIRKPVEPSAFLDLCARALRERALLRVEELLETRTRALRASEAQFRLLFESIPDAVCVHAADGTILAINEVGARWCKRPATDLVGQHISMLLAPHDVPPLALAAPPSMPRSTSTTFQIVCTARTGHHMVVEVTTRPIEFQGQAATLSVMRDVSERERAVAALQAAKEYAENLIDSSLDIIVSVDTERRIIAFNRAAQQAFGYAPEEVLGQPVQILYADPSEGSRIHHHALADGKYTGELTNRRKDGTTFDAYLSASVLRDDQGQVIGVMGISRDITERKQAEAALQASKEAAEAANRSKSAFLANVSHEIRTPMNGIIGMTELALGTALNEEQREYLELVQVSAEALLNVVNDLLDFSKIEAGKLALDPHDFALRASLSEAMRTLAVPAYRKGLEFAYEVHPEVPDGLRGDIGRLRQLLVNLVGNAIKFTPAGEVILRIALLPSEADTQDGTCVLHIAVTDTGIGIPEAQQQTIFQPFVQADGSTTRRYGGTGLGLSIAAQLVALMGGRLWVESTVGVGSTFHCTVQVEVQPEQTPAAPVAETLHGRRVLVVAARTTPRRILHALLVNGRMCPTLVDSGAAALEALDHAQRTGQPFAGVVLDADLPGEESVIVALSLQQRAREALTPLVVLTTPTRAGERQRWQDLQTAACLMKPVDEAEFWQAMHQVMTPDQQVPAASPQAAECEGKASRPLRVLLAEDNAMNQRLAVCLLEKRGHTVTVVQDGTEALAAVGQQPFDLVLMDVQMPHMDGLAATRAIRAQEQGTGMHLPIVAMTAHAMQGDREHCLAAGMDGYVPKPLRPAELFETIERLTAPVASMPVVSPTPAPGRTILDRKTLWERVDGDADLLREIIDLFLADCPERLQELHEALARQDSPALARAAHRFKGALGNISAHSAMAVIQRLETAARDGDLASAAAALATLGDELAQLTPLLMVCLEEGQPDLSQAYA